MLFKKKLSCIAYEYQLLAGRNSVCSIAQAYKVDGNKTASSRQNGIRNIDFTFEDQLISTWIAQLSW